MENNTFNYISATDLLKSYNKENKSNKVIAEFFSNEATKNAILLISEKNNIPKPFFTKRGKYCGGTWMHPELYDFFHNWIYKLPNKTFNRDEFEFIASLKETFASVLTFERQKKFDNFYVDAFCKELNLCIEFDENHHKQDYEKDAMRQKYIQDTFKTKFYRHNKSDNIFTTINFLVKELNASLYSQI